MRKIPALPLHPLPHRRQRPRLPRPLPRLLPPPAAAPAAPQGPAGAVAINAPMPGNILDVRVAPGDSVKAGDTLLILEAMKMENEISAPQDGTIATIDVRKGDTVSSGDLLVTMN